MRWFVWSILLFAGAVGVALMARMSIGNVAVFWPPYRFDASVNLSAMVLILAFLIGHFFLIGVRRALDLPARVRAYRERRRAQLATDALRDGLLAFFEGRFGRTERLAQVAQTVPALAPAAALVAARAAHRMRQYQRRDEWLSRVEGDPRLKAALLMTRAELAVEERQFETALSVISTLQAGGARHLQALRIALRAQEQSGQWGPALRTLRVLDKREAIHPLVSLRLRVAGHTALLNALSDDPGAVRRLWSEITERDRCIASIAESACKAFSRAADPAMAARVLEGALEHAWSDRLGWHYVQFTTERSRERLAKAEQWLGKYPSEPGLFLVLGELCMIEKLWGKARDYLGEALALVPASATIHRAMAQLEERVGDPVRAATHWRASALAAAEQIGPESLVRPLGAAPSGVDTGLPEIAGY
jgi:HemY protein